MLTLTILALISTSLALRAQFFIMAAIGLSLLSLVLGVSPELPQTLPFFATEGSASMEAVFAIFFPAVTGFTAGIAMSGDLKDPKKSIPAGTLWAIAVGFVVYIGLAIFVFYAVDSVVLRSDNNIFLKLALFAPAVVAGIWGATLSSALGGILGGPRILQAMSVDKITPRRFGKGVGKDNEPRNALFLTVIIAEAGILIGELDTIARICSMFYLAAYGFINLSFFLESWSSTDFNPTFKVKRWVGLLGFVATFAVMFRLDMIAMIIAFIVIGGIYFWLAKRELALGSGDVWQSVWSSVVKTGLRRMDEKQDHKRNWKPNVLLFSGGTDQRNYLVEFSKELVGNRGIVTNFDLRENQEADILFPKHKQSVRDEVLKKYGIFGRQIEVKNVFKGIETIAATFGFSGIDPNTILMGWAKNTSDPIWFAQMTKKLIDLDYNVLYLDYDKRFGFRKYAQIDLWWRGMGENAELMLNISKFLLASDLWRNARVRILLVDHTQGNKILIEKKIQKILETSRLTASIKVIASAMEQRPLYELMKIYSAETDLVLVGIPDVKPGEAKLFVRETSDLVGTIGTTLLVKASSHFDELNLLPADGVVSSVIQNGAGHFPALPEPTPTLIAPLQAEIQQFEQGFQAATAQLVEHAIAPIQEKYLGFYQLLISGLTRIENPESADAYDAFPTLLQQLRIKLQQIRISELPVLTEIFAEENRAYWEAVEAMLNTMPTRLALPPEKGRIPVRLKQTAKLLKDPFLFEREGFYSAHSQMTAEIHALLKELNELATTQMAFFQHLPAQWEGEINTVGRNFCNELTAIAQAADAGKKRAELRRQRNKKQAETTYQECLFFPAVWSKNQEIIHTSVETNLRLAKVNLLINKGLGSLTDTLRQEVDQRIETLFARDTAAIQALLQQLKAGKELGAFDPPQLDEQAFPGIEMLMQKLKEQTLPVSGMIPEEVVLMSQELREEVEEMAVFLEELLQAEVLEEVRKNTYTLHPIVKPNIENWLMNSNLIH